MPLRTPAHDSGSGWIANPSLYRTFTNYTPPAFDGAFEGLTPTPPPPHTPTPPVMERIREAAELCLEVQGKDAEILDFVGVQKIVVAS